MEEDVKQEKVDLSTKIKATEEEKEKEVKKTFEQAYLDNDQMPRTWNEQNEILVKMDELMDADFIIAQEKNKGR